MIGWHHLPNGHEFEQTLGDSEVQGSLTCCSPWGYKESDLTSRLTNNIKWSKAEGAGPEMSLGQRIPPLSLRSSGLKQDERSFRPSVVRE